MATVTRTTTFADGNVLTAAQLNNEFNNLLNALALMNSDVASNAGVVFSKLDSATVAGVTATQTLTNKTLTKPTVNGSILAYTSDTDGATVTFDMSASNVHTVTLGGNRTLAVSNVSTGQAFVIILKQDATGSRTVTWWAGIKWPNATAPTLTTTASRWDVFSFIYDGTNYYAAVVGQNLG